MEQNKIIEEIQTKNVEVDNEIEESSIEELESIKVDLTSENSEKDVMENNAEGVPDKSRLPITESQNPEKAEELYQKLKTEIIEEIRKYFDPILKERKPEIEVLIKDETLTMEKEDNLINRIIDESGW